MSVPNTVDPTHRRSCMGLTLPLLLLPLCVWTSVSAQENIEGTGGFDYLQHAAEALPDPGRWAFTREFVDPAAPDPFIARFDPGLPAEQRWRPIAQGDRPLTGRERSLLEDLNDKLPDADLSLTYHWLLDLNPANVRIVHADDSEVTLHSSLVNVGVPDEMKGRVDLLIRLDVARNEVISIEATPPQPFRLNLLVKVLAGSQVYEYERHGNGVVLLKSTHTDYEFSVPFSTKRQRSAERNFDFIQSEVPQTDG